MIHAVGLAVAADEVLVGTGDVLHERLVGQVLGVAVVDEVVAFSEVMMNTSGARLPTRRVCSVEMYSLVGGVAEVDLDVRVFLLELVDVRLGRLLVVPARVA